MAESKKVVIKLDVHNDKDKKKALKAVSGLSGIESISMDMKDNKLTVIGDIDPVDLVGKLILKKFHTEILTVGPAKEPEKKKEEGKKDDGKKDDEKKKDPNEIYAEYIKACKAYHHSMTQNYYVHSMEENPNACVIS